MSLLNDILHQVIAFIAFPSLKYNQDQRKQVTLSLNLSYIGQLETQGVGQNRIETARALMQIPPDSYFQENWNQAYPLWFLEKEWSEKEAKNNFKIVDRLVWTSLRLGATYQLAFDDRRASLNEAIQVIVGNTPLQSKQSTDYLCGEKAYASHFKHYKPVCHFIAAFEYMKSEDSQLQSLLELKETPHIERFFSLFTWFRVELLLLANPNVKGKHLLKADELIEPPEFLAFEPIHLEVETIPEKEQELLKLLKAS